MSNLNKTLQITSLLFVMITLFCFIAWHLGYDGLVLAGDISIPWRLNQAICIALFSINYLLLTSFILDEYSLKAIKLALPFLIFYAIFLVVFPSTIVSGPLSTLYLLIIGITRKDLKNVTIRTSIALFLTLAYQFLAIMFKTGSFSLNYDVSIYTGLMFSMDMIIFTALLWSIGWCKKHGRTLELVVFPGRTRDDRSRNESSQSSTQATDDVPVGKFEVWIMRIVILGVQILQWMFILWVCNLDNLFLDALVMTTSFICHGMIISKRQHFKPVILCTLAATAIFYFSARFTISFYYSNFFPIVIGLILTYTMYRVSYEIDKQAEAKAEIDLARLKKIEQQINETWDKIDKMS